MNFRIINDDAYNALDRLDPNSVDVCFTSPDPPFHHSRGAEIGIGTLQTFKEYHSRLIEIFEKVKRVLKDTGVLWVEMGDYHDSRGSLTMTPYVHALMMSSNWLLRSDLIWHRPHEPLQEDKTRFKRDCEHVFMFTKSVKYYFNPKYCSTSLFSFQYIEPKHGDIESGFPEGMIQVCLESTVPHFGVVLDPFAGTGVTGKVALKCGFQFIGIEIQEKKIIDIMKVLKSVK
jgi:DNA modification methylase